MKVTIKLLAEKAYDFNVIITLFDGFAFWKHFTLYLKILLIWNIDS